MPTITEEAISLAKQLVNDLTVNGDVSASEGITLFEKLIKGEGQLDLAKLRSEGRLSELAEQRVNQLSAINARAAGQLQVVTAQQLGQTERERISLAAKASEGRASRFAERSALASDKRTLRSIRGQINRASKGAMSPELATSLGEVLDKIGSSEALAVKAKLFDAQRIGQHGPQLLAEAESRIPAIRAGTQLPDETSGLLRLLKGSKGPDVVGIRRRIGAAARAGRGVRAAASAAEAASVASHGRLIKGLTGGGAALAALTLGPPIVRYIASGFSNKPEQLSPAAQAQVALQLAQIQAQAGRGDGGIGDSRRINDIVKIANLMKILQGLAKASQPPTDRSLV